MSAYNQVPRLTTTNPLKMHHNHNHHHRHLGHQLGGRQNSGPPLVESVDENDSGQSFGGGSSSGQRKWRVLLSIGLLLPALASIIGIVAWTISIEVANSNVSPRANQAAASAMAQVRRAERVQRQQQFRRDEAVALAAIIGARRGQQQARSGRTQTGNPSEQPLSAPLIQPNDQVAVQQQQQQQQQASHLNDTNDKSNKYDSDHEDEKQRRRNQQQQLAGSVPLRPTRLSQRQAAPTIMQSVASSPSNTPATRQHTAKLLVGGAAQNSASLPVVTNMDQLETLTSSSQETQSLPDQDKKGQGDRTKAMRKRDEEKVDDERNSEPNSDGAQEREDKTGDQSSGSRETPAPEQVADDESGKSTTANSTKSDEQDQGFEQTPIEQESVSGDDEKDDQRQQQQQQQPQVASDQNQAKNKSRWISAANGASKRPAKQVIETNKKLASAKQIYLENNQDKKQGHRFGATKMSNSRAKSNSEYKLLTPEPEAMTSERDEEEPVSSSTLQPQTTTTTTTTTTAAIETTTASNRDCVGKQPVEMGETRSDDSAATSQANNQDEVSFEAIASAISKSLSDSQAATVGNGEAESERAAGGDGGEMPARAMAEMLSEAIASNAKPRQESSNVDDETETNAREATSSDAESRFSDDVAQRVAKRRRTTGEHLAEVIDHIVEKRNHQRLARFGERTAADGGPSDQHQEGPQIVVVAPVGPNGALLKARSLTKEPIKLEGKNSSTITIKKLSEPVKKQQPQKSTRIGGRLLGVDSGSASSKSTSDQSNQMKYSERVEVIEDDDSSALLLPNLAPDAFVKSRSIDKIDTKKANDLVKTESDDDYDDIESEERKSSEQNQMASQQADLLALNQEQLSSIHVSSNSGEARSRSPRHDARQMFERYAPMPQQQQQMAPIRHQQPQQQQQQQPQHQQQQKLYSAEQVILEHVLKSKARSQNEQQPRPGSAQQQGDPIKKSRAAPSNGKATPQEASNKPAAGTSTPSTTTTTTNQTPVAATIANNRDQQEINNTAEQSPRTNEQQQRPGARQQPDQPMMMSPSDQSASESRPNNGERHYQPVEQQAAEFASMQAVQVPALFIQQTNQMPLRPRQFLPGNLRDSYQTMESQQQQVQMVRPNNGGAYESAQDQQAAGESQTRDQQSANENHYYSQQQQQQQQLQQALPVFADQEIQVPAHMAESVIRDLQQAPSTVRGVLNGQAALFQAQPTMMAQVPHQSPNHHQNHHLGQQHQMMMMMMQQHQIHQQRPQHMNLAESHQRPTFVAAEQSQQQQQPQTSYLRQALGYSPFALMSRLTSARRQPNEQQHQQIHHDQLQHDRQVLASRASGKDESKKLAPEQPQESSLLDTAVKALGPKGLMQPVAQMALKNLFNSLGQQAAAQQAQADAQELRLRSNQQRSSQQTGLPQQTPDGAAIQEPMVAGSSPQAMLSELPQGGRSMRSLPIGAQAPPSQQQMQPINMVATGGQNNGDQDVQESYGQMPAYHMAPGPHYQGGGGGGHGESYQGDHDKKTKGITFHFGGGPIGGGTQLITSPMGIFKHLMIPLLPNPRVNLNGKVVFGVVLEKSTAFGPPPKKKHFLWG